MNLKLKKISKLSPSANRLLIARKDSDLTSFNISEEDANYIKAKFDKDQKLVTLNQGGKHLYIQLINEKENINQTKEQLRKAANKAHGLICDNNVEDITIEGDTDKKEILLAYAEGLALSNYQFLKYFSDPDKKKYSLKTVSVFNKEVKAKDLELLSIICESVYIARDLVNEPLSYLTAEKLADEAKALSKKAKIKTTIYDKKKIESFGMGGLLAVNKGSIDPPTFTVMEWKPKNAINKQPLALVGKGVVFDTGGLSLKPTADSMDYMKSDMAGAAAVIATIYAV
ncbi:MAG: peptidase M17, partial [Bacteroidota bacterium]